MARLLLIALTVGLVVCKSPESPKLSTGYLDGHEYVYDYETQILSGLPEGSKIYSGLKLVCRVHFQMVSMFESKMEFRNPRLYKINSLVDSYDPTQQMLPTEAFTELLDEDAVQMRHHLTMPVTFSYMHGQVENVMTSENDQEWSVNTKKGCLSLMEVNFNERRSLTPHVDVKKLSAIHPYPTVFRVFEPSVTGECETTYRMMLMTSDDGTPNMQVEKVRNFENCLERTMFTEAMFGGQFCPSCNVDGEEGDTLTAQSMVRYEMVGSPYNFMIASAVAESMYTFVPMTEQRGKLMTFANQTMTLVERRPTDNVNLIPDPVNPQEHRRPLKAVKSPRDDKLRNEELVLPKSQRDELVKKVMKILTGITRMNENRVEMSSDDLVREMWMLLREMDKPGLTEVLQQAKKQSKLPEQAWGTLIDILPTVGTYESVDVLLGWMESNEYDPETAIITYIFMSLMPEPDHLTVERFINHINNYITKDENPADRNVYRTAWLCLGSLGSKGSTIRVNLVKEMKEEETLLTYMKEESNVRETRMTLDKRIEELKQKTQQTLDCHDKIDNQMFEMIETLYRKEGTEFRILALKVMSNLGHEKFLPLLEELALDREEDLMIRYEAVGAMMRFIINRQHLERIRGTLLPLFFDITVPEPLRINAFTQTMFARPSTSELEMIAKSLYNEPSRNVGSFVWDTLIAYSNSTTTCTCLTSLAHNSTLALRFARAPEENFRYSSLWIFKYFDSIHRLGFTSTNGIVFSPNERFPASLTSFMETSMYGRTFNMFGVIFRGQGLDSLYDSLLRNPKMSSMQKTLQQRFKRSVYNNEEKIEEIKEKLEVKPRAPVIPQGTFEIHLLNQNVFYLDMGAFLELKPEEISKEDPKMQSKILHDKLIQSLPKMLKAYDMVNRLIKTDRSFFLPAIHTWMPTETGLPLRLLYNILGSVRLDGKIDIQSKPGEGPIPNFMLDFNPSALIESRMDMMVGLRYYRSGVTTKIRNYMDTPFTATVGGEMSDSKLFMKITDMRATMPFVHEAFTNTFVEWIPYMATKYPQPVDLKEILFTANSDIQVYSYDVGQDFFGFKYTVSGQWARPKSPNVEQFPLCGKRTMYIKFDPMNSNELDIHFQHTTDYKRDLSSKDKGSGWWSWFFSPKDAEPESQEEHQPDNSKQPKSPQQSPLKPSESFINLAEKKLTISYLEKKFQDSELLQAGFKCGMVITFTRPGQNPEYRVQVTTLYQMDPRGLNHLYTMDLMHFTPHTPNNPWRMVTTSKMTLPSMVIEPSFLHNDEYQRQVQEQINVQLQRDARDLSADFNLQYYVMVNAIKKMIISTRRDKSRAGVQELINHVLEQSVSPELKSLKTLVQQQRQVESEARDLKDQPIHLQKVKEMLEVWRMTAEKAEDVQAQMEDIMSKLSQPQEPEISVFVQYLIVSQTSTLSYLQTALDKMGGVVPESESKPMSLRLEKLREKLIKLTRQQLQMSLQKQPAEARKARLEVDPLEMRIHGELSQIEKKLLTVIDKTLKSESLRQEIKPIESVLDHIEAVTEELDNHLQKAIKINRMVRVKMAEVLLQLRQITQTVDRIIKEIDARISQGSVASPDYTVEKRELLKVKTKLEGQGEAFAKRILMAVSVEKERKILSSSLSQDKARNQKLQDSLTSLDTITVRQLQLFELLNRPDILTQPRLQQIKEHITSVHTDLMSIISREILSPSPSPNMVPVLIKAASNLADQLDIIDLIRLLMDQELDQVAVNDGDVDSVRSMHAQMKLMTEQCLGMAGRILRKADEPSDQPNPDDRVRLAESDSPSPYIASLVRKAVKVDAKHLQLKSLSHEIQKLLKESQNINSPLSLSDLKEKLYKFIKTIKQIKEEDHSLYEVLHREGMERPYRQYPEELLASLERRQDQLHEDILTVETPLKQRCSADPALLKPLESLQLVKDAVQRSIHSRKEDKKARVSSQKDKKSPSPVKEGNPRDDKSRQPVRGPESPHDMVSGITGEATITFGVEGQKQKTILFKFLGRKTIEQLMWERDQSLPTKQDMIVRRYLEDRELPDDKTAVQYRQIKSELNSYRHIHVFCTYEETIPWTLKNYMFQFHQNIKFVLFRQAFISLPTDQSPLINKFEFIMDFDRNDQWMSMNIDTPYEITRVDFLEVPSWFRMTMFPVSDSVEDRLIYNSVQDVTKDCYVSPQRITTFDGKRIMPDLRPEPCESILAMDCSPDHRFVITKQPRSSQPPRVVVLTQPHRIVISRDEKDQLMVENNDHPIPLDKTPIVIDKDGDKVHISKVSDDVVLLMIPSAGVYVASDGDKAVVKVSGYYKDKVCGLCGNMDGSQSNDLTGPRRVPYPESKSLASTYLIPSDQCDAKSIQKELKVPELREQSERVTPLMHTAVLRRKDSHGSQICFSTTPVKSCPENTSPVSKESRPVKYHCMRSGRNSRKLKEEASSRILHEMREKSEDYSQSVSEPQYCS